jgi:hypothetical protein
MKIEIVPSRVNVRFRGMGRRSANERQVPDGENALLSDLHIQMREHRLHRLGVHLGLEFGDP